MLNRIQQLDFSDVAGLPEPMRLFAEAYRDILLNPARADQAATDLLDSDRPADRVCGAMFIQNAALIHADIDPARALKIDGLILKSYPEAAKYFVGGRIILAAQIGRDDVFNQTLTEHGSLIEPVYLHAATAVKIGDKALTAEVLRFAIAHAPHPYAAEWWTRFAKARKVSLKPAFSPLQVRRMLERGMDMVATLLNLIDQHTTQKTLIPEQLRHGLEVLARVAMRTTKPRDLKEALSAYEELNALCDVIEHDERMGLHLKRCRAVWRRLNGLLDREHRRSIVESKKKES